MSDVRKKGTGTWDPPKTAGNSKKLGIRKTPQQLADILGEPVPEGKIASRPFWEKYLTCLTRPTMPRSGSGRTCKSGCSRWKSSSRVCRPRAGTPPSSSRSGIRPDLPEWDIDHADVPAIHPDAKMNSSCWGSTTTNSPSGC